MFHILRDCYFLQRFLSYFHWKVKYKCFKNSLCRVHSPRSLPCRKAEEERRQREEEERERLQKEEEKRKREEEDRLRREEEERRRIEEERLRLEQQK